MSYRLFILLTAAALASCGNTKLLTSRTPPDETAVIDAPSLALPPDFTLRPPSQAEDYETVLRAQKTSEAQTLLTGVSGTAKVVPVTGGEAWLLKQAGEADTSIRDNLETDVAAEKKEDDKGLWQKLVDKVKK